MGVLHIDDVEAAINYWRSKGPDSDIRFLLALAEVYALMAVRRLIEVDVHLLSEVAWKGWLIWYETTPDTPCIAICTTSQGDNVCKGCSRTFEEITRWPEMTPVEKRGVWRRLKEDRSALFVSGYPGRIKGCN